MARRDEREIVRYLEGEELERLRVLKEHELGAWIKDDGGTLIVKPVEEK